MKTPPPRRALTFVLTLAGSLVAATGLNACGSTDRTVSAYCTQVNAALPQVAAPAIATPADITATIRLYRAIADHAPAAVEPEWATLIKSLETASGVDPSDPASIADATDAALATAPAAARIRRYTQDNCQIDIGTPPTAPPMPESTTPVAPETSVPASPGPSVPDSSMPDPLVLDTAVPETVAPAETVVSLPPETTGG